MADEVCLQLMRVTAVALLDKSCLKSFGGAHVDRQASGQGEPHVKILILKNLEKLPRLTARSAPERARSPPSPRRPSTACVNPLSALSKAEELRGAARLRSAFNVLGKLPKNVKKFDTILLKY